MLLSLFNCVAWLRIPEPRVVSTKLQLAMCHISLLPNRVAVQLIYIHIKKSQYTVSHPYF